MSHDTTDQTWEQTFVEGHLSQRALNAGSAYTGPGAGQDVPSGERPPIAFTGGLPDPVAHPTKELTAAMQDVMRDDADGALQYGGPQGFIELRDWLGEHQSDQQHLEFSADNFILTNGASGALVLLCDTFLNLGDMALVEELSFPGTVRTIRSVTSRVECVHVDDDGIDIEDLERALTTLARAGTPAKLLYSIADFHNPTGAMLSLDRRKQVIDLCAEHGTLIVEDQAYTELPFDESSRTQSMYSLTGGEGVAQIGTFSKVIAPGLRVGWLQARPTLIQTCMGTRSDMGSSPLGHRLAHRLAASGFLADHIVEVRRLYQRKCDIVLDELERSCTGLATWNRPKGGFFIWLQIADDIDAASLAESAEAEGVSWVGGQVFAAHQHDETVGYGGWAPGDSRFFRLAFSYVDESQLREGVQRIGRALERSTTR